MKNWEDIPGLIFAPDVIVINEIVRNLPDNCKIVEVGSMIGKSAVAWCQACISQDKKYELLCIDTFRGTALFRLFKNNMTYKTNINLSSLIPDEPLIDTFNRNVAGYNIRVMIEDCNTVTLPEKVHCIFEDSDHSYDTLSQCLPKFWDSLIPGGILCGHDYSPDYQGVIQSVTELSNRVNCQVTLYKNSTMWSITKKQ